ncbi:hypothetical protein SNEBB_003136 [Seison nebaliae]|nr:hypothetical protein SNEBB_003136 [Seison nebaliae]
MFFLSEIINSRILYSTTEYINSSTIDKSSIIFICGLPLPNGYVEQLLDNDSYHYCSSLKLLNRRMNSNNENGSIKSQKFLDRAAQAISTTVHESDENNNILIDTILRNINHQFENGKKKFFVDQSMLTVKDYEYLKKKFNNAPLNVIYVGALSDTYLKQYDNYYTKIVQLTKHLGKHPVMDEMEQKYYADIYYNEQNDLLEKMIKNEDNVHTVNFENDGYSVYNSFVKSVDEIFVKNEDFIYKYLQHLPIINIIPGPGAIQPTMNTLHKLITSNNDIHVIDVYKKGERYMNLFDPNTKPCDQMARGNSIIPYQYQFDLVVRELRDIIRRHATTVKLIVIFGFPTGGEFPWVMHLEKMTGANLKKIYYLSLEDSYRKKLLQEQMKDLVDVELLEMMNITKMVEDYTESNKKLVETLENQKRLTIVEIPNDSIKQKLEEEFHLDKLKLLFDESSITNKKLLFVIGNGVTDCVETSMQLARLYKEANGNYEYIQHSLEENIKDTLEKIGKTQSSQIIVASLPNTSEDANELSDWIIRNKMKDIRCLSITGSSSLEAESILSNINCQIISCLSGNEDYAKEFIKSL